MASLDTTILVDLLRRRRELRRRALDKLDDLHARNESLVTTRFNLAELYLGAELSQDPSAEYGDIATLTGRIKILEFDDIAARLFAEMTAHLRRIGRPAGDMDVLIAATALAAGHCLVTRNPAHFADIPGVAVETY
jgi:predicted nucleic acid-binding protein